MVLTKENYEDFCGKTILRLCNHVEDAPSLPKKYVYAGATVTFGLLALSALELWEQWEHARWYMP